MDTRSCSARVQIAAPLLTLLALACLGSQPAAQLTKRGRLYELTVIQQPGALQISGVSVNALGSSTVTATSVSGTSGFVWSPSTGLVSRAPLAGFTSSTAIDIDRFGAVIGTSFNPATTFATRWTPAGLAFVIPVPDTSQAVPNGLNDAGVVVGVALKPGGWNGWVWDATNGVRDLGVFGLPLADRVSDVNESNQVAGNEPFGRAFVLDLDTSSVTYLGTLGGECGALALNERGHVVGWARDRVSIQEPFLWTPSTGTRSLGSLLPPALGPQRGWAYSVNDSDRVVGFSEVQANDPHAFLWDPRGGMFDLNDLVGGLGPYKLTLASHISSNGWIVGSAIDTSAGNKRVGFVLRPG